MAERKKILLFSYYFPPAGGISCQRIIRFAKFLREYGWEPIIISGGHESSWKILDNSLNKIADDFTIITYLSKNSKIYYAQKPNLIDKFKKKIIAQKIIHELDPMHDWATEVSGHLSDIISIHRPSAALITVPPFSSLELIESLKKIASQLPVIADMRDLLWIFYPYGSFIRRYAGKRQYRNAEYLIPKWLSLADAMTVPDAAFVRTLKEYSSAPIEIVPTPFDPDDFSKTPKYERREKFTILHSGSLNKFHDSQRLHYIFSLLPDDILAQTELILQGHCPSEAKRIFWSERWSKVLPSVSHREALSMQCRADANIAFVTVPRKYGGEQMVPGKVFDYIGAGRPIIGIGPANGALNSLIKLHDFGFTAPIEEPPLAAGAITKAFRLWQQNSLNPITEENKSEYSAKNVVAKLAKFLNKII